MKNVEEKSILIPVSDERKLPSLEKIISLAGTVNLKVHLAGFISPSREVSSMISQTIRLTQLINSISKVLKNRLAKVSSKIYVAPFKRKIKSIIENEKVILIATSNLSDGNINLRSISKDVMVLQLSASDVKEESHDVLLMHKIKQDDIKAIADISRLFGDRLYVVQQLNNEAVQDLTKSFGLPKLSGLDRQAKPEEVNEWLLKHKTGLIALNKAEVSRGAKQVMEVLKNGKTPVLLY
jgi:hypothetical protein